MPHLIAKTGLFEEKTMQKSPSFPTFNLKPQNPSESGIFKFSCNAPSARVIFYHQPQ
jgi:hypothetical protein